MDSIKERVALRVKVSLLTIVHDFVNEPYLQEGCEKWYQSVYAISVPQESVSSADYSKA